MGVVRLEKGIVFVLALAVAIGLSALSAQAQETSEEHYKNIKVLNDMPADQMIGTMRYFEAALGVGCDFCHTERATRIQRSKKQPGR